jgi:hypothetical protein
MLGDQCNVERVDLDGLRRQTYLWRRRRRGHLPPACPAQERWLSLGQRFASGLRTIAEKAPSSRSEIPLSIGKYCRQITGKTRMRSQIVMVPTDVSKQPGLIQGLSPVFWECCHWVSDFSDWPLWQVCYIAPSHVCKSGPSRHGISIKAADNVWWDIGR